MPHASTFTRTCPSAGLGISRSTNSQSPPGFPTRAAFILLFINTWSLSVFSTALFGKKSVASCSIELKASAKSAIKQSRGNEAVQSAQHHAFTDGVMQARRLRGRRVVNNFGNVVRIVSIRGFLLNDFCHSLFLVGVGRNNGLNAFFVLRDFGPCVHRLDQHRPNTEGSDFMIQRGRITLERMFARSVNPAVRPGKKTEH